MKVLLIQPNYRKIYTYAKSEKITPIFPPLGLAYMAAVLKENNVPVKILEANALNLSYEEIKKELEGYMPDIVGITASTAMIEEAHKIAKLCPETVKVVIGGIHASSLPDETLKKFKRFNFLVRGEGEFTMLDLAKGKNIKKIRGLSYRKGKIIVHNEPRELIKNLDSLPFFARELLPMDRYFSVGTKQRPSDYILSSRGCPYNCIFCADYLVHGKMFRYRSPENVIKEVRYLADGGVKDFEFVDDNFTFLPERVEKFCGLMISNGLNKKISWRCSNGIRVDKISLQLLRKMKKAGCYMVSLGIEAGNERILKNIRKNINLEQVRNAVKWCREVGIETKGLFMFGNLGEDEKTMQDTINFAKKLDLDTATFHITIPFPSTEYWNIIKEEGILYPKSYRDYLAFGIVIFKHGNLTEKMLIKMQKKAYREFYFRPKIILRAIKKINSLERLKIYINAAIAFLGFS